MHVRVLNAISGQILQEELEVSCIAVRTQVLAALYNRQSRPVTLCLKCDVVTDDSFVEKESGAFGEVFLEFTAVIGDALADGRVSFRASLATRS